MFFIKYKLGFLLTISSVVVNLLLFWFGAYDNIEQNLYDFRFRLRGPLSGDYIIQNEKYSKISNNLAIKNNYIEDNDVIIIGIDQASFESIGLEYPYNRSLIWSRVIKNLVDANISVIVFDIMFDKELIAQDTIFSKAIDYAKENEVEVVLAANYNIEKNIAGKEFRLIKPSKHIINDTHVKLGLVGAINDYDGFIRRYISVDSTISDINQENFYSLGVQAVLSYKNNNFSDLKIPVYNNQNSFLINFFGPNSYGSINTFRTLSLYEILDDGKLAYNDSSPCYNKSILTEEFLDKSESFMQYYLVDNTKSSYFKNTEAYKFGLPDIFSNKIAIIGSALKEDHDTFNTPFNAFNNQGEMYGVELHANAIQQILDHNHINTPIAFIGYDTNINDKLVSFIICLVLSFLTLLIINYFNSITSIVLSFTLIIVWFNISIGAFINDYFWIIKFILSLDINIPNINKSSILPVTYPILSIIFSYAFNLSFKVFMEQKDKKFFKDTFGQYISPDLINQMYKKQSKPTLGGDIGLRTAFFTDIRGFSSISEELSATDLVELLNEYLSEMTDILLKNKGTLDKYEGDAILAMFGAPITMLNHADMAINTAIEMQNKLNDLRIKWSKSDKWPTSVHNMFMRVGISSGNFVVGNMGSSLRMDYTMMGDVVNTAARLESAAKGYGIGNCCDIKTLKLAESTNYLYRYIDKVLLVGKKEPIEIVELLGFTNQANSKNIIKLIESFEKAMIYYYKSDWKNTIKYLKNTIKLETNNKDNPSKTFIKRCEDFIIKEPSNWDGIFKLENK